jgi:hypothetical protein
LRRARFARSAAASRACRPPLAAVRPALGDCRSLGVSLIVSPRESASRRSAPSSGAETEPADKKGRAHTGTGVPSTTLRVASPSPRRHCGKRRATKPILTKKSQGARYARDRLIRNLELDVVGEDHRDGALGRIFGRLIGMIAPPRRHAGAVAIDGRAAGLACSLERCQHFRNRLVVVAHCWTQLLSPAVVNRRDAEIFPRAAATQRRPTSRNESSCAEETVASRETRLYQTDRPCPEGAGGRPKIAAAVTAAQPADGQRRGWSAAPGRPRAARWPPSTCRSAG